MNHHFANAGDVMKHLALMRVVELVRPGRYLESHSGAFDYPLAEREDPIPDGVWSFLAGAPSVRALQDSAYRQLLGGIAGSPTAPGVYPGSLRCAWELLGLSAEYRANDTDNEALASLNLALDRRGARTQLSSSDGIDMVIDGAEAGDFVLIDPFDPEVASPEHGLSARDAFDALVGRGVVVVLWRALHGCPEDAPPVTASDLTVSLRFEEHTGSMDGCELVFGNIGPDVAADVARLAVAHGAILCNGRIHVAAAHRPVVGAPVIAPAAGNGADRVRSLVPTVTPSHIPVRVVPAAGGVVAAGVDGCSAGWVAALAIDGGPVEITVFPTIDELAREVRSRGTNPIIAIDVPIGLPTTPNHRPCDKKARARLKCATKERSREGSVFQVPDRELVALSSFEEVQHVVAARRASDAAAKGISKQSFALAPKILEVDNFVRHTPGCEQWLLEVHPEVCFLEMSGEDRPLLRKKGAQGRDERMTLLSQALAQFGISLPDPVPRIPGAKPDDVLDAFVGLWTAMRHRAGTSLVLGGERDEQGVIMRMLV